MKIDTSIFVSMRKANPNTNNFFKEVEIIYELWLAT